MLYEMTPPPLIRLRIAVSTFARSVAVYATPQYYDIGKVVQA
jgi:hypothetical protein